MGKAHRFDLVMDQTKFVRGCPSGRRYYFQAGPPLEVADADVDYFTKQPEFFVEVDAKNLPVKPDTTEEGVSPAPSSPPITSKTVTAGRVKGQPKKKPAKKEAAPEPEGYDLDALDADTIIENDILAKKKKGPWTCTVCGKKGIKTSSGLRSHVGSAKCVITAREKQG